MNIQEIKVSECAAFQDNPFQVRDDEGMALLVLVSGSLAL